MKQFNNLSEATTYHRKCYVCGDRLVHPFQIDFNPEKPPVFKWNLSEAVDSDTNDWLTIDSYTNKITYLEQSRKYYDDTIYSDNTLVDRFRKYTGSQRSYSGTLYESVHIHCGKCYQFSYVLQVVINATKMILEGIFLDSEFISYEDKNGHLHEIRNVYPFEKTEYACHKKPTAKDDSTKRTLSIPIIPLNLLNPAETVGRIRKLVIFS